MQQPVLQAMGHFISFSGIFFDPDGAAYHPDDLQCDNGKQVPLAPSR